jgi:transcriptional regulator with XRE-family HTH domain
LPFCSATLKIKRPINPAYPKTLVTIGDHIRKRRLDLGLKQVHVARALGVSATAVTGWEKNRREPNPSFIPKIIAFLGYTPPVFDKEKTVSRNG